MQGLFIILIRLNASSSLITLVRIGKVEGKISGAWVVIIGISSWIGIRLLDPLTVGKM